MLVGAAGLLRISDVLGARLPAPPVMGVRHDFASGVFGWGVLSPG